MEFNLSENQLRKLFAWQSQENKHLIKMQKEEITKDMSDYQIYKSAWDLGYPYAGSSGADLSYNFTPSSIGTFVTVKNNLSENEINLTEYESF